MALVTMISIFFLLSSCTAVDGQHSGQPDERPNILLIVADDLGFSDLGVYGGEIPTPTIDALAAGGALFTNFHTSPTCSPSRAMLLTGVDNHLAGLGNMKELTSPAQRKQPGYEGYLNDRVVTIAQLLLSSGYETYMSGKWHLGDQPGFLPPDRGFKRSFALLEGAGSHYNNSGYAQFQPVVHYLLNGQPVSLEDDYYSTTSFTNKMIEFVEQGSKNEPFFAYLAYTAPHWPLQAPQHEISQFQNVYQDGWDAIRERRFIRMLDRGVISPDTTFPPRWDKTPAWRDMSQDDQRRYASHMAIYAAMVSVMDQSIARLLDVLEETGQLDNTVVVFLSDNGAEGRGLDGFPMFKPWIESNYPDNGVPGSAQSFIIQGPGWGQVSTTPHRLHKNTTAEGGIRSPLIVSVPGFSNPGAMNSDFIHVADVVPTLLQLAGMEFPSSADTSINMPNGRSLLAQTNKRIADHRTRDEAVGFELNGNAAVFQGRWKALRLQLPYGQGEWELYDLEKDQPESNNVALVYPEVLEAMTASYKSYSKRVGVVDE